MHAARCPKADYTVRYSVTGRQLAVETAADALTASYDLLSLFRPSLLSILWPSRGWMGGWGEEGTHATGNEFIMCFIHADWMWFVLCGFGFELA